MRVGTMATGFAAFVRDVATFAGGWRLAGLAVLVVVAAAAEGAGLLLLIPILNLIGVDGEAPRSFPIGLEAALALYVLLVTGAALVVARRSMAVAAFRFGYADSLRRRMHRALMGMEWRTFCRLPGAEASHALISEAARAAHGVDFLLRLAGWTVEILVLLAVALHLSSAMTATALVLAAVCLALTRPLDRRAHALGYSVGEANRALQADITDNLAGMRVIRALALEDERCNRVETRMEEVRAANIAFQRSAGLARAATQALAAAAAAAVWVAVRGMELGLAEALALMMGFARLLAACLRVQDAWRIVLHALPAHAAVQRLLAHCEMAAESAEAVPVLGTSDSARLLTRSLKLDGVVLRYRPEGVAAVAGVEAEFPAGSITALIGPSGAGKSTVADLLLGLFEPDEGRVLVDGQPLVGALRRAWRRRVGYVPQDSFLFHDTIRANLAAAAPQADEAALWVALDQAAAGFVRALPAGLDTVVGDRGGLLSGGQRQRLALARALLMKPELLILDEATSALDFENERRVLNALGALRGSLTMVVVTHRPSTARFADHVVPLDAGRVAAPGNRAADGAN
ncbi:MAG TPA: ABC transporter ATP-binding protein [Azospirillaceae bacterium]|nr:ABC transporter ATP-binding protein [Azospirillaceae bacterium]